MSSILHKQLPEFSFQLTLKHLFVAFLFFSTVSQAQELVFENFTTRDGLPSNEVYDIYQDSKGLLWFATDRGICNYNGYSFKSLGLKDGLTSITILHFYPQKNGDIWCSTINNRFFYFNPGDYIIHEYHFNDILEKESKGRTPHSLYIEEDGSLHVGFHDKTGVVSINSYGNVIDEISLIQYRSPTNDSCTIVLETMSDGQIFSFIENVPIQPRPLVNKSTKVIVRDKDRFYNRVAKRGGIELISGSRNAYIYKNDTLLKTLYFDNRPISIGFIDHNHFWVGVMYNGARIYDLKGNYIQSIMDEESITSILTDHENGIWISTLSSGVYYTLNRKINRHLSNSHSFISSLSIDNEGMLLANTYDGGVYRNNIGSWGSIYTSTHKVPTLHQYYDSIKMSLTFRDKEILWNEKNYSKESLSYITKLSEEQDCKPWLTGSYRFYCYDNGTELTSYNVDKRIKDVCPATDDKTLYLASNDGLFLFDYSIEKLAKINNPIVNISITDIDRLGLDTYLMTTLGKGLVIMNQDDFWSISENNGLSCDITTEVYIQNDSTIWVCTNDGLNRILLNASNQYSISTFNKEDGLIDKDVTDVEILNDTVWVSTRSGLCSFPTSVMDSIDKEPCSQDYFLQIIDCKVNGETAPSLDNLNHSQNKIEIQFQAISFKQNTELKYRYKLYGHEETWNYTSNLKIIYEKLPPGNFTFLLQVESKGVWCADQAILKINISPPFYQTLGFRLGVISLLIILIYLFFKYRILSYNKDISREILRQLLKRLKKKSTSFIIREKGRDVKINSEDILYIKSADNYIEIYTDNEKIVTREKISNFLLIIPDPIEYLRIHRSCIVRIDKISAKSKDSIIINNTELKVGNTFLRVLSEIHL